MNSFCSVTRTKVPVKIILNFDPSLRFKCYADKCIILCCKNISVNLTPNDVKKLESLGFNKNEFLVINQYGLYLKILYDIHGISSCVFLRNGLCSIHEQYGKKQKPSACRLFPIQTKFSDGSLVICVDDRCPGVQKKEGILIKNLYKRRLKEIESFHNPSINHFFRDEKVFVLIDNETWNHLIKRVYFEVSGLSNDESLSMILVILRKVLRKYRKKSNGYYVNMNDINDLFSSSLVLTRKEYLLLSLDSFISKIHVLSIFSDTSLELFKKLPSMFKFKDSKIEEKVKVQIVEDILRYYSFNPQDVKLFLTSVEFKLQRMFFYMKYLNNNIGRKGITEEDVTEGKIKMANLKRITKNKLNFWRKIVRILTSFRVFWIKKL